MTMIRYHGLEAVELRCADGARAIVTLHGAHVVSWVPAGSDQEQLYMSPRSDYAAGKAIRGGVPVVFPQFSNRGPLVRHGFARNLPWKLAGSGPAAAGGMQAVFRLVDSDATRALWPHAFELEMAVRLGGTTLDMALSCRNMGSTAIDFTCALHTYLQVHDLAQAAVLGLEGRAYWDSVDGQDKVQPQQALRVDGELDRVYLGVDGDLQLREMQGGRERALRVGQQGFEDTVVWNPGPIRCAALPDMPAEGYRNMLCIESARIGTPVNLQGGERWSGVQRLTAGSA